MTSPKRENLWLNLALNVVVPSVIMSKGQDWLRLPSPVVLVIALAFPVVYGIYDKFTRRKVNLFSVIGFVSILITGAIGLLRIEDPHWIAVKEAAVPLLFGIIILATAKSKKPFVHRILYSPEIFDVPMIDRSLEEKGTRADFEQVMLTCTYWIAGSFALSSVLNYFLARFIVTASPLTDNETFVRQTGVLTAWSWPVIVLPSMVMMMVALVKLIKGIERCTGHTLDEAMHPDLREKTKPSA